MTEVTMKTRLSADVDDVWRMVGNFSGIPDWHPMIEKSEISGGGERRTLSLPDGSRIVEELRDADDGSHTMTYAVIDSPLPVMNYSATIQVRPDKKKGGCTVEWSSSFEPTGEEGTAVRMVQDLYTAGFENLRKMFGTP